METAHLECIDFAPFMVNEGVVVGDEPTPGQLHIAERIDSIAQEHGFAFLKNTGITQEFREVVFGKAKEFFEMPSEKKLSEIRAIGEEFRGFVAPGVALEKEEIQGEKDLRFKNEAFLFGSPQCETFKNCPVGMQQTCEGFWSRCELLSSRYCKAMDLSLGLDNDYIFKAHHKSQTTRARFNYYQPCRYDPSSVEKNVRFKEHEDFGTFTMVFNDGVRGLQIKQDGIWKIVEPPAEAEVLLNTGKLVERLTNGRWKATLHRVVSPSKKEAGKTRVSIACFVNPNHGEIIKTPRKLARPESCKFEPVVGWDYILSLLKSPGSYYNRETEAN